MSIRCKNHTTDVKPKDVKYKNNIKILILSILILLSISILIILLATHFSFTKKTVSTSEKPQLKKVGTEKDLQNEEDAKTAKVLATLKTPELLAKPRTSHPSLTTDQSKAAIALNQFDPTFSSNQTTSSIGTQTPVKSHPKHGRKLGEKGKESLEKGNEISQPPTDLTGTQSSQEDESEPEDLGFSQVEKEKVIAALTRNTRNGFLDVKAFSIAMNKHTEHTVLAYEFFSKNKYVDIRNGTKSEEVISFCKYFKIDKIIIEEFISMNHMSEFLRKNLVETATTEEVVEEKNKFLKAKRKLTFDD